MPYYALIFIACAEQIANKPSIYVLDTPGVLVPKISDMETGLKLALTGMTVQLSLLSLFWSFRY